MYVYNQCFADRLPVGCGNSAAPAYNVMIRMEEIPAIETTPVALGLESVI